jgi:hypothetical protein
MRLHSVCRYIMYMVCNVLLDSSADVVGNVIILVVVDVVYSFALDYISFLTNHIVARLSLLTYKCLQILNITVKLLQSRR